MKLIISSLLFVASLNMMAAETTSMKVDTSKTWNTMVPYLAGDFGFMEYTEKSFEQNNARSTGVVLGLDTALSQRWDLLTEVGMKRTAPYRSGVKNSGVVGLAAVYEFTPTWSFGPVATGLIGNGESYGSSDNTWTGFAGAELMKRFELAKHSIRVALKGMTDINIENTQASLFLLQGQYLFGKGKGTMMSQPEVTEANEETEVSEMEVEMEEEMPLVDSDELGAAYFAKGKAQLSAQSKSALEALAKVLKTESGAVEKIEVVGYADSTGSEKVNEQISAERAKNVAKLLNRYGISSEKIEVIVAGDKLAKRNNQTGKAYRKVGVKLKGMNSSELNSKIKNILSTVE